jgi:hypothetical protein
MVYRLADLVVRSSVVLPELAPAARGAREHWEFSVRRRATSHKASHAWFHHWYENDQRRSLSFARTSDGYCLRFHRAGDFDIAPARRRIQCTAPASVSARTIRHLFLNQVVPLVATERRLVLHASAVVHGSVVTGFLGPGGAGKSTLAAALCQSGAELVTDDALMLDRRGRTFRAIPTYAGLRLWPDAARRMPSNIHSEELTPYSRKRRVGGGFRFHSQVSRLSELCVLDAHRHQDERVSINRLAPLEALIALLPCTFQLDVSDARRVEETFHRLIEFVRHVPVYQLRYPWSFGKLEVTAREVTERLNDARRCKRVTSDSRIVPP